MLEFYQAYSEYRELMDMTEELFRGLRRRLQAVQNSSMASWRSTSKIRAAFDARGDHEYWPTEAGAAPTSAELVASGGTRGAAEHYNLYARGKHLDPIVGIEKLSDGELTGELFEAVAEAHLVQPTFIYDFPTAISPLSNQSRMIRP